MLGSREERQSASSAAKRGIRGSAGEKALLADERRMVHASSVFFSMGSAASVSRCCDCLRMVRKRASAVRSCDAVSARGEAREVIFVRKRLRMGSA